MSVLLAFVTSLAITLFAIPSIIKVAQLKHLFDCPEGEHSARKSHENAVPTLGGMAIFAGMIFSATFWSDQREIIELQYIMASMLILFFIGIKDDLIDLVAWKKLFGQILAAIILVHFAEIRIYNIFGLFGVNEISLWVSYPLTVFTIVVITNSFNLIDGIDGLAGAIGVLTSVTFGAWFLAFGETQFAIWAFSLAGSLLAFLYFNKTPAKIFMGDTGSLIIGLTAAILAIQFIELNRHLPNEHSFKILSVPVVAISILVVPLFDTLRVFLIRFFRGVSPFASDRRHIHHRLVDLGLTHLQATALLFIVNFIFIVSTYYLQDLPGEILLLYVIGLALVFDLILFFLSKKSTSLA